MLNFVCFLNSFGKRETVVKVQPQPLKYLIAWEIFQKKEGIGKMNRHDKLEYVLQFQKKS